MNKNLVRKLKWHPDKPFKLKIIYRTKNLSYYCNTEDKVPEYLKSHIVYEFCYPACNKKYIWKTDRKLGSCVQEHSSFDRKSPLYNHFLECEHVNFVENSHSLSPGSNSGEYLEDVKFGVYGNTKIIDNSQNWVELCFFESLCIKWKKPKLKYGIKVTKELALCSCYHKYFNCSIFPWLYRF